MFGDLEIGIGSDSGVDSCQLYVVGALQLHA